MEARGHTEKSFLEKTLRRRREEQQEVSLDIVCGRGSHKRFTSWYEIDVNAGRDGVEAARQRAIRKRAGV